MPSRYRLSAANRFRDREKTQRTLILRFGQFGFVDVLAVGLVMTIISAISIMPRLMPCNSSPAPEIWSIMNISTIECTAVSDCPTPTVSMKMTSNPAASHRMIVSRVLRATPPSDPAEGEGRMKTWDWTRCSPCGSCRRGSNRRCAPSWVDGQYRQLVLERGDHIAYGFDEGRFSGSRDARDADAYRFPGMRQALFDDLLRLGIVVGVAAFYQGDGLRKRS